MQSIKTNISKTVRKRKPTAGCWGTGSLRRDEGVIYRVEPQDEDFQETWQASSDLTTSIKVLEEKKPESRASSQLTISDPRAEYMLGCLMSIRLSSRQNGWYH
eukprot:GHVS01069574.1.p1 GENE.GHVS01069574.1~~GHVS01069574.1.p1  ORF type:complete len:103 (+),score=3.85 GHVS01069574.1:104-412(+)